MTYMTRDEEIDRLELSDEDKAILKERSNLERIAEENFGGIYYMVWTQHPELRHIPLSECQVKRLDEVTTDIFVRSVIDGCRDRAWVGARKFAEFMSDLAKKSVATACGMLPEELCYGPMMRSRALDYHAPDDEKPQA